LTITDPFFADVTNGETVLIQCRAMDKDWELPTLLDSEIQISDNCGTPSYTMTQDVSEGTCSENGYFKKIVVKIKVKDECANETNLNFNILIVDTIPPVFTQTPEDVTVSCEPADGGYNIAAEDECECAIVSYADTKVPGDCPGNYTVYRKYTAKDCCGNASYYTQKITVIDTTGPLMTPISTHFNGISTGDTIARNCEWVEIPEWLNDNPSTLMKAYDDCHGEMPVKLNITLTNQDACWNFGYLKLYVVSFTSTDECGNSSEYKFYIKIVDHTPPTIQYIKETVCADDKTYPVVVDNCTDVTYSYTDEQIGGFCPDKNNFIRTWTFTDACGNTSYATQYLTSNDHKAPIISLTSGPYAGARNGDVLHINCSDWRSEDRNTLLSWVSAIDDCDIYSLDVTSDTKSGDCARDGYAKQTSFSWTATDNCGNKSVFEIRVQLTDDVAPHFEQTAPVIEVGCENNIPPVKAIDDCSDVKLSVERTRTDGSCPGNFVLNEHYTARDACGNIAELDRKVIVNDKTGPIIYAPDVICEGDEDPGAPYAVDDCTNKPVQLKIQHGDKVFDCDGGKYYEVYYSATDACGNTTTKTQRVITNDHTPPILTFDYEFKNKYHLNTVNPSIEVGCEEFDSLISAVNKDALVIAKDNCSDQVQISFAQKSMGTYCDENELHSNYLFTWTATDICGNSSTLQLIVKMSTNKIPDLSFVPADTTVYCLADVPALELPALKCGFMNMDYNMILSDPTRKGNYTETRTWTIENECHEQYSASQVITHMQRNNDLVCSILAPSVFCNSSENQVSAEVSGGYGPYTYKWEVVNGSCHILSGQGTPDVIISIAYKTLNMRVTITDANGCNTTCDVNVPCAIDGVDPIISGEDNSHGTSVNFGKLTDGEYVLRPNPTTSLVFVEFKSELTENVTINVTDQVGNIVLTRKVQTVKGFNSEMLNTSALASGVYMVTIISPANSKTLRLVKVD
jgi:hypothetical protein